MGDKNYKRITLGSGDLFVTEFTGDLPELDKICVDNNFLGYIQGGASLEYKPTFYEAKDDTGKVTKIIITDEEAILKSGILTFNAETLKVLSTTGRVTDSEDGTKRTIKIGGISNADNTKYVICFHHKDKIDGDIWVVIVGQNQSGFTLAFAKDKETVIDAEFKALPQDDEGTLIKYIEEIKNPVARAVSQNSESAPSANVEEGKQTSAKTQAATK